MTTTTGRLCHWPKNLGTEVVQLLVGANADVNSKDSNKSSPLAWAVTGGLHDIIDYLLTAGGVDIEYQDAENWTPLFLASKLGHDRVMHTVISSGGVDPMKPDRKGHTRS